MAVRPEVINVYDYVRTRPCKWLSRREVADALGITYSAARYRLGVLARLKWIREYTVWPPRRIFYHYAPPVPPPPPPPAPPIPVEEEFISDEECTGHTITYHGIKRKYIVRHGKTGEILREEEKVALELTASISTNINHDVPLTCEITATSYLTPAPLSSILKIEKEVEEGLRNWLIEQGWGALTRAFEKVGVAYNSETHVETVLRYPFLVPDYPEIFIYVERRSRYIGLRSYTGTFRV